MTERTDVPSFAHPWPLPETMGGPDLLGPGSTVAPAGYGAAVPAAGGGNGHGQPTNGATTTAAPFGATRPDGLPVGAPPGGQAGPQFRLPASPALICDRAGVVRQANEALAKLAGVGSAAELVGANLHRLVIGSDDDATLSWPASGRAARVRVVRCPLPPAADGTALVMVLLVDVTGLQQAARALADERRRVVEVERVAGLGSWEYDPATGQTVWSQGHYELLAIEPGTVVPGANAVLDIVHPDDREALAQYWAEHLVSGTPIDIEYRVVRSDGQVRRVQGLAEAKRDETGRLVRFTGSIRDITEQRHAEEALAEERARLLEAQRISRLGSWSVEVATARYQFSAALLEMFAEYGVDPRDDPLAAVHPDDRPRLARISERLTAEPDQTIEIEFRGPAPADRVYVCRARAERNGSAEIVRVLGTVQDVTALRAAETRMRRSSQRFADLVSIAPVGIGLFDAEERLVDANDALCELLGYTLDQLRGRTAAELTHPDDKPGRQPLVSAMRASGQSTYTVPQVVLQRAGGEAVYCELHISVSVQDDGQQFWLVVFSDVTERLRAAEVLRYQATHDDLTRLPNRSAAKQLLGELLCGPNRSRVAVLFCDIDNFKRVNDSLGHDAGDELLVALARRLVDGLPEGCTAARLSGDEYLVICPDTSVVGGVGTLVTTVSQLLRAAIPLRGQIVQISATVGAATPEGPHAGPEDLLRFADAAMYQAKGVGPGGVALASAALMASADRQVALEGQLREALGRDELVLDYQPVVGPDGRVLTAEALIRWPHPERGLLAPDVFLPVAEQGDLMRELDRWVLRNALREAAGWPACDGRRVAVAVNLAGLVPGDPEFVDLVSAAVADSGLPWDLVVLELVETALVDLPSRTRKAMAELAGRGVRFAVDDFGTGYSSLARLRELPAQIIKVDRQFVSGVGTNPSDFAVARAVVDMARAMGRSCVAEGVETPTQFHVLRGLGVEAYQGWLISRPVPPHRFRSALAHGRFRIPGSG